MPAHGLEPWTYRLRSGSLLQVGELRGGRNGGWHLCVLVPGAPKHFDSLEATDRLRQQGSVLEGLEIGVRLRVVVEVDAPHRRPIRSLSLVRGERRAVIRWRRFVVGRVIEFAV